MKPKIDLERLKSLHEDYKQGFGGNVDFLADSVPDLIELLEEAKEIVETCKIDHGYPHHSLATWLNRFQKKEGEK